MVETGKLVSQASREFLGGLDQWEPRETRDQWETRDLRDLQECPDLLAPGEILGKMAPLDSPGLQASLDQQEREGWLAPPAPEDSRECRGRRAKTESRAGMGPRVCRDLQA